MSSLYDPPAAFTVAQGAEQGFTRWELDSARFDRPFHGVRAVPVPVDLDLHPLAAQRAGILLAARRFAAYMHAAEFFSHTTAAVLWDLPLPRLDDTHIDVSVAAPSRAPAGAGVRGHQLRSTGVRVVRHSELDVRLTDPASTWALLGAVVRHPYDLVAIADSVVREEWMPGRRSHRIRPAHASLAQLRSAIPAKRRGVRALREAADRVRQGAASRPETWMRLIIVDAALPEPVLDHDVYDARGRFLGCVDGAYPHLNIALEYEGDHHRTDPIQWQRDIEKHDDLVRAGWRVIRVTRHMVFDEPSALVIRVREALRRGR